MKIGFDLDEVLMDFINPLTEYYNLRFGTDFGRRNYRDYELWKLWGCSQDESNEIIHDFLGCARFESITPKTGSVELVKKMAKCHELHIITARPSFVQRKTTESLHNYFGPNFRTINFSANPFSNASAVKVKVKPKALIAKELDLDAMVEDSAEYASECAREGVLTFLINTPWNIHKNIPEKIIRLERLQDIALFIDCD